MGLFDFLKKKAEMPNVQYSVRWQVNGEWGEQTYTASEEQINKFIEEKKSNPNIKIIEVRKIVSLTGDAAEAEWKRQNMR